MNHLEASNLLTHYLSGDLDSRRRKGLEEHISRCADCAEWVAAYALFDQALGRHPSSDEVASFALAPETLETSALERCREHLEDCRDCRHEVDLVRQAAAYGKRGSRLGGAMEPAFRSRRRAGWVAVAATVTLVLGVSLFFERSGRSPIGQVLTDSTLNEAQTRLVDPSSILVETTEVAPGAALTLESRVVGFGDGFSVMTGGTMAVFNRPPVEDDDSANNS